MKKHPEADILAARLSAAANQPPGLANVPVSKPAEDALPVEALGEEPNGRQQKSRTARSGTKGSNDNTVPISLRPGRSLLDRYVNAAAERTRKAGRVISAQQIMLEVLERGI